MSRLRRVVLLLLVLTLATAGPVLGFDVPRINGIRIDGSGDDWGDRGFEVAVMSDSDGRIRPANDFDVRFRLAWDRAGLLALVEVQDDLAREADEIDRLRYADSIEILVAQSPGSSNRYGLLVAPGADASFPEPRSRVDDYRPAFLQGRPIEPAWAATTVENGYVVEARLGWEDLGIEPRPGVELAFQLTANDDDGPSDPGDDLRLTWYPSDRAHRDARRMHALRLARHSSPAELLAATRDIDESGCVVTVRGAREALGREVTLRSTDGESATRRLTMIDGRAGARFELAEPPGGATWPRTVIESEGRTVAVFRALPTLQAVLDRWIDAAGGREVLERITTRTYLGELAVELASREPPRETGTLEIRFDGPDRWEMIVDDNLGTHRDHCDGGIGWRERPDGRFRDDRICRSLTALLLDPQGPLRLRDYYPELTLRDVRLLDGVEAYRVEARSADKPSRMLYFDVETGQLVQIGGNRKLQDYRPVDGVMVPHRIETSRKGGWAAYEFHSVTHDGVGIQARFIFPATRR